MAIDIQVMRYAPAMSIRLDFRSETRPGTVLLDIPRAEPHAAWMRMVQ